MAAPSTTGPDIDHVNQARLLGRVSGEPEIRTLPSGDQVVEFRLVVDRDPGAAGPRKVDTLDCAAWSARTRRAASSWRDGDLVEVEGAIRRRFFGTAVGRASRVSIEVSAARRADRSRRGRPGPGSDA